KGPKDPVCHRVCGAQAPRGSACRPRFAGFPESADAAIEPEAASRLKQRGLTKYRKGPEQLVGSWLTFRRPPRRLRRSPPYERETRAQRARGSLKSTPQERPAL